jgi:hypothetical protein
MMVPWTGVPGSLDTMCLTAAVNQVPTLGEQVEAFALAAGVNQWSVTKRGKMKLRSFISANYMTNPYIPPAWVWREGTSLVPLSDPVFNQVASFLADFATLVP